MRRPFGPESHATGSSTASRLRDAMETRWGARGAERTTLSALLTFAADVANTSTRRWTEADVAKAFGVRESMVTKVPAKRGDWRWSGFQSGLSTAAPSIDRLVAIVANYTDRQWDPAIYPFSGVVRMLDARLNPPTVTVIDRRVA